MWPLLTGISVAASLSLSIMWFTDPPPFQEPFTLQGHPLAFVGIGVVLPIVLVTVASILGARRRLFAIGVYGVLLLAAAASAMVGRPLAPREPAVAGRPNVLLVTLDTTRADRFASERVETPSFDRLAQEGVRFSGAFAPIPVTGPSHATLLSSRSPWSTGMMLNGAPIPPDVRLLPERLSDEGYATAAFTSAYVLDGNLGFERGFSVYDDDFGWVKGLSRTLPGRAWGMFQRRDPAFVAERRGGWTVGDALQWLDRPRQAPFFAWVHLFDAHGPYEPTAPFDTRYYRGGDPKDPSHTSMKAVTDVPVYLRPSLEGVTDVAWVIAQYDGEVSYADAQLGRLLDWLDESGHADDTLVVVVGDHGESLGEDGQWFTHGATLGRQELHVPFAMRQPREIRAGSVVRVPVEVGDIAPTILSYLRLPAEPGFEGSSLRMVVDGGPGPRVASRALSLDVAANRAARAENAAFPPTWVQAAADGPGGRCVVREVDGAIEQQGETPPCDVASTLIAEFRARGGGATAAPLSGTDREMLAALGYVDGAAPDPPEWSACEPGPARVEVASCPYGTPTREAAGPDLARPFQVTDTGAHDCLRSLPLMLPTGRLVAADPRGLPGSAFDLELGHGPHPVWVSRVDNVATHVLVQVGPGRPVSWRQALLPDEEAGVELGFASGSGMGALFDASATELDGVAALDWRTVCVDGATEAVIGPVGPGVKSTWIGVDGGGEVAAVVTDLGVVERGEN
jgi:arylsulfatase A-like enzyme